MLNGKNVVSIELPNDLAIETDSRIAMSGVTKIVVPRFWQMSPKLNVWLLYSMKKGGATNGGIPDVILPNNEKNKQLMAYKIE